MTNSILMFGHDAQLLETRKWVLEKAGYVTVSAHTLSRFNTELAKGNWRLLILCHTLSESDCRTVASLAAAQAPGTPVLVLRTNGSGCAIAASNSLNIFDGPKNLIATVSSLSQPLFDTATQSDARRSICHST